MLCIKLEGENRVVMDTVFSYIAEKYDISEELAMSWLIAAIWYLKLLLAFVAFSPLATAV